MALAIRDVSQCDLDAVLALNNGAAPGVLPLDREQLMQFFADACYFRLAEVDGHIAGFLIALRENLDYPSENYRWFQRRNKCFVYIDRIVVAPSQRGLGVGRVLYCDVQSYAEVRVPMLACEVFLEPRNDAAVLFHGTYGFQEVGQQVLESAQQRRVSLLAMELPSFAFVSDRYHGDLPNLPWLRERDRPESQAQRSTGAL